MARVTTCIITSSEEGRPAFGITTDTNESVFFSASLADHMRLEEFDQVEAIVIDNDRPEPPLKAIRIRRPSDNAE